MEVSEKLVKQIVFHEGFRPYIYDDMTGERVTPGSYCKGTPTIGIGFTNITIDEAQTILRMRLACVQHEVLSQLPWVAELAEPRQFVMFDMCFNLGMHTLCMFVNFLDAMRKGEWTRAVGEMKNSKWWNQVGQRSRTLARMVLLSIPFEAARASTQEV